MVMVGEEQWNLGGVACMHLIMAVTDYGFSFNHKKEGM